MDIIRARGMDPALYEAATRGNVARLRELVDPEDPGILISTTPQLNTALHLAALHGHAYFAREVLDRNGELLVAKNDDGDTPLHLAAKAGDTEVAEVLVNSAQAWEEVLVNSAQAWAEHQIRNLVPLAMINKKGNTPLHEAVRHQHTDVALKLLVANPNCAHDLNKNSESPLDMAARQGLVQVVRRIVDVPWVQDKARHQTVGGTTLHQAVLGGHLKIVEILLDKCPELIDLSDSDGNNALHYAAQKNHRRAVEMLLNKRAALGYHLNHKKASPLHIAARNGSTDAIKALLRHCPDAAEMVDEDGRNALHVSVAGGQVSTLRCLLRHIRAPELLNCVDSNGDTPLHLAARMGHVKPALLLLDDQRVDPCIRDRRGHTARGLLEAKFLAGELHPYEMYLLEQLEKHESKRCPKDQVPSSAILSARRRPLDNKDFDKVVDAYFIAATLIATVTFAATFTMPGGYDQIRGIAIHGRNAAFKTFVVSNTVAMCSSIFVIFLLIWARQEPVKLKLRNLLWSQTLTIIACLAMLLALMTAVYVTVAPTAPWPAYAVAAIGTGSPIIFFLVSWIGR